MENQDEDYFDMMYEEELELMKEQDAWVEQMGNQYEENKSKERQNNSKRSLNFSNCDNQKSQTINLESQTASLEPEMTSLEPQTTSLEPQTASLENQMAINLEETRPGVSKKRTQVDYNQDLPSSVRKKARIELEEDIVPSKPRRQKIPNNDFISVTGLDGSIIYVDLLDRSKKVSDVVRKPTQLLWTPLSVLKAQIFDEILLKNSTSQVQRSVIDLTKDGFNNAKDEPSNGGKKLLWVDKYSPRGYSDLISEEATNRNLLRWLKLWDYSTFGKEPKVVDNSKEKLGWKFQKNFGKAGGDQVTNDLDKNKRPMQKVALMNGPPGFGKTTLAHIIARHAGYNVVEMNASDDRAVQVFREKVEAATQMRAVMGEENPLPNCLIIDEIDGAPQPAIEILINMIKRSDPSSNPSSKSGKKKKDAAILRPIICICNDLYVPALRQLRQMCFLVHFHAPHISNLTIRLTEISKLEDIKADASALKVLCEKAENDIRSCINTLQFIKTKCAGELKSEMVANLSLGQKDFQRNLFSTWISIFTLPKPVRPNYVEPNDRDKIPEYWAIGKKAVPTSERLRNILQIVSSSDEGKLHQGLFENYLNTNIKDPRMKAIGEAIDWLCNSDLFETQIHTLQNYSLMKYQPFVSAIFHLLFAVNRPNKIVFPKANFEFHTNLSCSKEIFSTFLQGSSASVQSCTSSSASVLDTIPYMSLIIQPSLRPVNIHLYSAHEKRSLSQVVKTMMYHGLSYRQEKNQEGQFNYALEPNIEKLSKFSDSKNQKQMSYSCKQLISREIELERLRQSEGLEATRPGRPRDVPKLVPKEMAQPKQIKEVKGPVDFFGRRIEKPVVPTVQDKDSSNNKQASPNLFGDVWYRYKEGFSNAVKRSCKVKDFL